MPPTNPPLGEKHFFTWLSEQRDRHDPVGAFAKDAWQDAAFPRGVSSGQDLITYMESRGAKQNAVEAAKEAWIEFGGAAEDFTKPDDAVDWNEPDEELM
ncbi:MAG: hypothetical protein KF745_02995 [Phycisphaeraceae bacterium]|nr:hypothetical protein [Phycisphaeraceae bacterium]